jgi:hypothetical protein
MNYSKYPSDNDTYFSNQSGSSYNQKMNCMNTNVFKPVIEPSVTFGYNKPISEACIYTGGIMKYQPSNNGSSIWNNLTKRKSLVKE